MNAGHTSIARARHLVALQRWQEAIEAVGPAVTEPETASSAHCLRAQCELGLGRPRRAVTAAKAALAIDPHNEWGHRLLGVAHLQTGRKRQARDAARAALRLNPGSVEGYHLLALALLARRDRSGALEAATAAVESDPYASLAHETVAVVRAAKRDWKGAEAAYREGLRLAPEDPDLAIGLAETLRRQRRRGEAAEVYLAAGRSDPTDGRARQGLARLGLPLAGASWLALKLIAYGGARTVIELHLRPLGVALILAVVLVVGAGVSTALRFNGTRDLPDGVREGLHSEHRNAALGWLRAAGFLSAILALWAGLRPAGNEGGPALAAAFLLFAVVAIMAADHYRVGAPEGWHALIPRWRPRPSRRRRG